MVIGGTDSSGGAGLTRDAQVAHHFGVEVMPVVTAVTAQSHHGVQAVQMMSPEFVMTQIRAAMASCLPGAVKIGLLGNGRIAETVAEALSGYAGDVVLDPVLQATSGGVLMSGQLPDRLLSQVDLITPNLPEAGALTRRFAAQNDAKAIAQSECLLKMGPRAVLLKGGHGTGAMSVDHLFTASDRHRLSSPRIAGSLRGTGCAMATAIACGLAEKQDLLLACQAAKAFIQDRLCETVAR